MFEDMKTRVFQASLVLISTLVPALAFSQTITVDTVEQSTSATSVAVPWTLDPGSDLQGFQFTIAYDSAIFTPDLTNCVSGVTSDQDNCEVDTTGAEDVVSIGLLNFSDPFGEVQSGSITFEFTAGTTAGDYPLTVTEFEPNTVPEGTTITVVSGAIQLRDIAPSLSLSETQLAFSAETGQTSAAQTVEACNDGNADGLTFSSIALSGTDATNFAASDNCPETGGLAQGDCCEIAVTFSPDAVADFVASLDVTSSNGSGNVDLTGTGTAGPAADLAIEPTSFDFGPVLTGAETAETSFTISNSGEAGSTVLIDAIGGLSAPLTSDGTCEAGVTELAAGASCTVSVVFAPTADGPVSQSLQIDGTDTLNETEVSATATVTGEGVTEAIFSSNPAPGDVDLGFAGAEGELDLDVLVSNTGNAELSLTCSVDTNEGGVFTIAPLSLTVAADGSSPFNVACSLPDLETYSATLSCDTNDEDNATVEYTFTCSGLEPLPVPTMSNWSIALFALIMLLVGGFSIRFFRT